MIAEDSRKMRFCPYCGSIITNSGHTIDDLFLFKCSNCGNKGVLLRLGLGLIS
ncbi:MAG: hypothetical protein ACFFBS_05015 [Promethearchaeota archaeon]